MPPAVRVMFRAPGAAKRTERGRPASGFPEHIDRGSFDGWPPSWLTIASVKRCYGSRGNRSPTQTCSQFRHLRRAGGRHCEPVQHPALSHDIGLIKGEPGASIRAVRATKPGREAPRRSPLCTCQSSSGHSGLGPRGPPRCAALLLPLARSTRVSAAPLSSVVPRSYRPRSARKKAGKLNWLEFAAPLHPCDSLSD